MALTLRVQCPICGNTERLNIYGPFKSFQSPRFGSRGSWTPISDLSSKQNVVTTGAAVCEECHSPFGVILKPRIDVFGQQIFSVNTPHQSDEVFRGGSVETVPSSQYEISEDASLPEKIRSPFVHAQEDANRRRHATGIMASARGCLDVALKELGASKGTRRERIKNLSEKGIITAGIAEWAQALWDEGNDAVHDLEADMDRAIEHIEFLKLFFAVAFTLPAQIAESKTPSEKDN